MDANGSMPRHMSYTIRQNASFTPTTNLMRSRFWFPGPRNWGYEYYQFGFVWLQDILERAMVNLYTDKDVTEPGTYIHQFPYPCYIQDQFLFMIEHVMPLCMAISWVYSVAMLVQNVVYEKEKRLKEVMKTMGLNNAVHWLAWFITSFIQMTITAAVLTAVLKYGRVLTYSNPLIFFLVLETFVVANITFSFLVSVLYSKAKLAAACAGIVYFLTYVPYMYIAVREEAAHNNIPAWLKSLASLLSTTAFGLGAKYFAFYEEVGVGVQWANLSISPLEDDDFSLGHVAAMMLVDAFIYSLLVWYIENVHPGSYGLPRPWYFPLTHSYWFGGGRYEAEEVNSLRSFWRKLLRKHGAALSVTEEEQACAIDSRMLDSGYFEPDPTELPLGVCIDNLVKIYKDGKKLAVNRLSLNLYEGQITSFLGHNGAGKTTTMSILTGLFPPTSGYALIYGRDIRTEMDIIRQNMGMCPQHNVLFDELTVEEHLWFYARLKQTPDSNIKDETDKIIQDLSLPLKRHSKVDCLSGGMKRKLSVAIAFVGGSHVVILDEPTAGVDPYSRRAIWDLILKYKKERTILLSTHHMDEADVLGDRIAVISHGQLRCCGTSLFLKNNLGKGYHLTLVKQPPQHHSGDCGRAVTSFIRRHVETASLVSETQHELHYILPLLELRKGSFEKLFSALEASLGFLGISSYGIKNTTLEEVFLKVAEEASRSDSEIFLKHKNLKIIAFVVRCVFSFRIAAFIIDFYLNLQHLLLLQQLSAILLKRYYCTRRNWKGLFSQILLPAFFVGVAMSVALTAPHVEDPPPLVLSPSRYYNYTQPRGNVVPYAFRDHPRPRQVSFPVGRCLVKWKACMRHGELKVCTVHLHLTLNLPCKFHSSHLSSSVWYNNKGYHAMPTYVNSINNAILRANLPPEKGHPSAYGITVINHPMTDTSFLLSKDQILQGTDVLIAIFIIVAMSFVPASFVLFLVYERYTKAKHLQIVSGVNPIVYWLANYFWDICSYVVPATCCVLILLIFDIPAYTSAKNFPAVLSLFLMYGWSITPVMYPVSFLFKEPSTAYIFLIVINLFVGITCIVTSFLLEVFSYDAYLGEVHHLLKTIFLMFPNYCLGRGLMDIAFNEYQNFFLFKTDVVECRRHQNVAKRAVQTTLAPATRPPQSRASLGRGSRDILYHVMAMYLAARGQCCRTEPKFRFRFPLVFKIRFKNIYPIFRVANDVVKVCVPEGLNLEEDEDVRNERRRVLNGRTNTDALCLMNLTKLGKHLAVDRLCLRIPKGECFGLLGVNGAGKSTTFKMLTGDTEITSGDAFLNGYSVSRELNKAQRFIGYCPQFDALYDELTAKEHLRLYARFRGIPIKEENRVIEWTLQKLGLTSYADRVVGTYSGGNKRKLSTAIALLGGPPVIYLDEPTTGMDPYTRRFLWDLIQDLVRGGRSVILTSHSMEECEALCTRLAIMVNGHFKCLGSIQHLKNRFGEGYCITARTKGASHDAISAWFHRVLKLCGCQLQEQHFNMLQYELKSENISLAYVFCQMEQALGELPIEEYSVCQNTLDNVFINFVKQQSERGREPGVWSAGKRNLVASGQRGRPPLPLDDTIGDSDEEEDIQQRLQRSQSHLAFLNMDVDC
ncbi:unnamed protein product [Ixodes persulcatus]